MNRTAWATVLGVVALLVLSVVASLLVPLVGGYGYGWGMGPRMMGGGIMMLLFWVLIIIAAIWLVQSVARGANSTRISAPMSESPLDILKLRYAKGEINKEQFDQMKRDPGL